MGGLLDVDWEKNINYIVFSVAAGIIAIIIGYISFSQQPEEELKEEVKAENKAAKVKENVKDKKSKTPKREVNKAFAFSHPWLSTSLKGHSQAVTGVDFSVNGKYAITCAGDRTALIWPTKEFGKKDHKPVRANIELDHATKVRFSPDGKAFLVSLGNANTIRIYKIGKKEDGSLGNITPLEDFPQKSIEDLINIGISCNGKFIMSAYRDTKIIIWDLKGQVLDTIDTHQVNNNFACVSPCGRFVASCGFTPDVKVWEVCFTKAGEFRELVRAFELKGHSAGVYSFAFSLDSTRMASVSKDGTWKLWNTDIEYQKNQDPYLLLTGKFEHSQPSLIALSSATSGCVVLACGSSVYIYNTSDGQLVEEVEDVHSQPISCLAFSPDDSYFVTAGDKHVRVFHNIHGYRAKIVSLQGKLKAATNNQPLKERLQEQINEARQQLETILGEEK